MSFNYTLKYRTFDSLVADCASDFKKYQLQDIIDPQDLIKVAKRVNYDLGLRIHKVKETVLEVEKGRVRLPNDFYVLDFALVLDEYELKQYLPQGTHVEESIVGSVAPKYVEAPPAVIDTCATDDSDEGCVETSTKYSFKLPNVPAYDQQTRFRFKVEDTEHTFTTSLRSTPEEVAEGLTALGVGTWTVESTFASGNTFNVSHDTLEYSDFDVTYPEIVKVGMADENDLYQVSMFTELIGIAVASDIFPGTNQNLYTTEDGGETWIFKQLLPSILPSESYSTLDVIFKTNATTAYILTGNNIYITTDAGTTVTFLCTITLAYAQSKIRDHVWVGNTGIGYAVIESSDASDRGIWKTIDNGTSWNRIYDTGLKHNTSISINPNNPNELAILAGSSIYNIHSVYHSENAGVGWLLTSGIILSGGDLKIKHGYDNTLYYGSNNAIHISHNNGLSWAVAHEFTNSTYPVSIQTTSGGLVLVAGASNATLFDGSEWIEDILTGGHNIAGVEILSRYKLWITDNPFPAAPGVFLYDYVTPILAQRQFTNEVAICDTCELTCVGDVIQLVEKTHFETRYYKNIYPLRITEQTEDINGVCPNLYWESALTGVIRDGWLHTSFQTGKVYLNYQGHLEDNEGNLLVPDHDLLNEYYEYALKQRIIENLIMNDEEVNPNKMQLIESRFRVARNNARSMVNTPNFAEIKELFKANRNAMYSKYFDMFARSPRLKVR